MYKIVKLVKCLLIFMYVIMIPLSFEGGFGRAQTHVGQWMLGVRWESRRLPADSASTRTAWQIPELFRTAFFLKKF